MTINNTTFMSVKHFIYFATEFRQFRSLYINLLNDFNRLRHQSSPSGVIQSLIDNGHHPSHEDILIIYKKGRLPTRPAILEQFHQKINAIEEKIKHFEEKKQFTFLFKKTAPSDNPNPTAMKLRDPTSRGLSAGSSDVERFMDPAGKPRDVGEENALNLMAVSPSSCPLVEMFIGLTRKIEENIQKQWCLYRKKDSCSNTEQEQLLNLYKTHHPTNAFNEVDALKRLELHDKLQAYVDRIDSYGETESKFRHGFWFCRNSRSVNRRANYLLARHLIKQLKTLDSPIGDIFNPRELLKYRYNQMKPGDPCRKIHSEQLKTILDEANNYQFNVTWGVI